MRLRYSAVGPDTAAVLIVAEAMHGAADADVQRLTATLVDELSVLWSVKPKAAILTKDVLRFEF